MGDFNWSVADWLQASYICITALGIIVTAFVGVWVVNTVQKNINKESTLKDHFAREIISLRDDARKFIEKLISGNMKAEDMKSEHYFLQRRMKDIVDLLDSKYYIGKQYLKAYRLSLPKILEADANYKAGFKVDTPVVLDSKTKNEIHRLGRDNDHVFNEILLKIYG